MDHVIDRIETDIDIVFDDFFKELMSNKFKKYCDCPSYYCLKAYIDSTNCLRKYLGWNILSIKEMVRDRVEDLD